MLTFNAHIQAKKAYIETNEIQIKWKIIAAAAISTYKIIRKNPVLAHNYIYLWHLNRTKIWMHHVHVKTATTTIGIRMDDPQAYFMTATAFSSCISWNFFSMAIEAESMQAKLFSKPHTCKWFTNFVDMWNKMISRSYTKIVFKTIDYRNNPLIKSKNKMHSKCLKIMARC